MVRNNFYLVHSFCAFHLITSITGTGLYLFVYTAFCYCLSILSLCCRFLTNVNPDFVFLLTSSPSFFLPDFKRMQWFMCNLMPWIRILLALMGMEHIMAANCGKWHEFSCIPEMFITSRPVCLHHGQADIVKCASQNQGMHKIVEFLFLSSIVPCPAPPHC